MGGSALTNLLLAAWETPDRIRFVALLYGLGGVLAFPVGLTLARLLSRGRDWETALAAAFVSLVTTTLAFTGGLFALQYRSYYAEWHAPALTLTGSSSSPSRWRLRSTNSSRLACGSIFRRVLRHLSGSASGLRGSGVEHWACLC
ncbi:hypothetical protein [Mesorhizobium argentiipisi]|uniref:hypothetical protein n=1 Tax=Mesorhizobium argentiipisi TaxID=3015175 RepID=UPI00301D5573